MDYSTKHKAGKVLHADMKDKARSRPDNSMRPKGGSVDDKPCRDGVGKVGDLESGRTA